MESKDGDVSFEVNTSILYFAGVDEVPQYDPRITDSHSTRSTLAFWNGKLMFNQDINIFTEYVNPQFFYTYRTWCNVNSVAAGS